MRLRLIEVASVVALVAFAGSNALAQGAANKSTTAPSTTTSKSTTAPSTATSKAPAATAPSTGPWTADNVTAARPFGNIDIAAAGKTSDSVRTWVQGRSASERAELTGRCGVITNTANASRYPADAQQFCRNYMMVASASPPAGKASTTTR